MLVLQLVISGEHLQQVLLSNPCTRNRHRMGMCVICSRAVRAMSTPSIGHTFCPTVILIGSTVDYDRSPRWVYKNVHYNQTMAGST
jgi:hypothetical protein